MHQASVGFHCPECVNSGKQKVVSGPAVFQPARPVLTQILIAVNVAVFLVGLALDRRGAFGGNGGTLHDHFALMAKLFQNGNDFYLKHYPGTETVGVGGGQWYRMVTSGFLHYGIIHLALNMYALWVLGRAVENLGGRLRFAIVYVVALLAGSLGALVITPDSLTAGASGAIFGLMGAIFLAQRAQGIGFRDSPLLGVLLLNLAFTFGIGGISIGGHIGGLIGGAAAGWVLFDYARRPGLDKRIPLAICGALAVAFVVAGVVFASAHVPA